MKKLLVSQPKPATDKSPYFDIAAKYGIEIEFKPFIKVERLSAREFRAQKINILDHTAIIFTSRHGIDHFFHLCEDLRVSIPETMKYFCVAEKIALYIQKYVQYRKRKVFYGATGKFEDLLPLIVNDDIKNMLDAKNIQHTEGVMYRTVSNVFTPEEIAQYDGFIFFSPAGVTSLLTNDPNFKQGDVKIGTLGLTTAQAVKDAGLRLDFQAPTAEAPSMTAALENFLKEHS